MDNKQGWIKKEQLILTDQMIIFDSPVPLKTVSSAVIGSEIGWYQTFVNRHVDKSYHCDDHKREMTDFLIENQFHLDETVGMMTAVDLQHVTFGEWETEQSSIVVVVTAGVGNAVDAALGKVHVNKFTPGTINTWVLINGNVTDEAFIQSIVTATEAKTKALREAQIMDQVTASLATGTSTDSILIAASQQGRPFEFGGPISELGALIGEGVFTCTKKALEKTRIKQ